MSIRLFIMFLYDLCDGLFYLYVNGGKICFFMCFIVNSVDMHD